MRENCDVVGNDVNDVVEVERVRGAIGDPLPYGCRSPSDLDWRRRRGATWNPRPSSGSSSLARAFWTAAGSASGDPYPCCNRPGSPPDARRARGRAWNPRPSSGSRSWSRVRCIAAGSLLGALLWGGHRRRTLSSSRLLAASGDESFPATLSASMKMAIHALNITQNTRAISPATPPAISGDMGMGINRCRRRRQSAVPVDKKGRW